MSTLVFLALTPALAQSPATPWRTIHTEHYRLHYPVVAEPWALQIAGQIEEIRERVVEEVGWAPIHTVDVLIRDPISEANGMAFPLWHGRMVLWATPPAASSVIGTSRGWAELLVTHEATHLVHLLREPRNPLEHALWSILGIGPILAKAPRWVIEGYATVVEGRLTGSGRPNGDLRAQMLRQLAQAGRLPTYDELDGSPRWMGGSWAYLVGSAYLEWLEVRAGAGALRDLWARMSARRLRSFDEAFAGVFGDGPRELYGRFTASLTADAMRLAEAAPPTGDTLFEARPWGTGPPAVSPDGAEVMIPSLSRRGPGALEVFATEIHTEVVEERRARIEAQLRLDPEDVAPVASAHEPHERRHRRVFWARTARSPRWLPDGRVLLDAWVFDGTGRLRPDLFVWDPQTHREERITVRADVHTPDPSPDGTWAVAVRSVWSSTQLVRIELGSGAWEAVTEPSVEVQVDHPRIAPGATHLAWLENPGTGWGVVVLDLESQLRWTWAPPAGGPIPRRLVWAPDGALCAELGEDGFIEVHEIWREGSLVDITLTRTEGGALAPDVAPDGTLYHLSLTADGLDMHRTEPGAFEPPPSGLGPLAVRPRWRPGPPPIEPAEVEPEPYGLGPAGWLPLLGTLLSTDGGEQRLELGLGVTDPAGRYELLALGAISDPGARGLEGARLGLTWRSLPLPLAGSGYLASDPRIDANRLGASLGTRLDHRWGGGLLSLRSGGFLERALGSDPLGQRGGGSLEIFGGLADGRRGLWGLSAGALGQLGATGSGGWGIGGVGLWGRVFRGPSLQASYALRRSSGSSALDQLQLGGMPSSILPGVVTAAWIPEPLLAARSGSGAWHDRAELRLDLGGLSPFVRRHRIGGALQERGTTLAGLSSEVSFDAVPFAHLPSGAVSLGLACTVEDPVGGLREPLCTVPAGWGAWASVTWSRR